MKQTLLIISATFLLGLVMGGMLHSISVNNARAATSETQAFVPSKDTTAPGDHIPEHNISVGENEVVIKVPNAVWAKFTPSGSMRPVLDEGANAIEIIPREPSRINAGDIISYQSDWMQIPVIHRVIETGADEDGWFAIVKGDNNASADPGKIRFAQVRRVVVAIIY